MKKKRKIPLSTAIWAEVYNTLTKHGVVFPKKWNGIGACYGGYVTIQRVLEEYKVKK